MTHPTTRPTNLTDAELKAFLDDQYQLQLDDCADEEDDESC